MNPAKLLGGGRDFAISCNSLPSSNEDEFAAGAFGSCQGLVIRFRVALYAMITYGFAVVGLDLDGRVW